MEGNHEHSILSPLPSIFCALTDDPSTVWSTLPPGARQWPHFPGPRPGQKKIKKPSHFRVFRESSQLAKGLHSQIIPIPTGSVPVYYLLPEGQWFLVFHILLQGCPEIASIYSVLRHRLLLSNGGFQKGFQLLYMEFTLLWLILPRLLQFWKCVYIKNEWFDY